MNRTLTTTIGVALLTLTACTTVESPSTTTLTPLDVDDDSGYLVEDTAVEITSPVVTFSPSTQRLIFIDNIESTIGVPVIDEDGAVETGYLVCDALRSGSPLEAVMSAALDSSTTDDQLLFLSALIASAITVFCPEMSYLVDQLG